MSDAQVVAIDWSGAKTGAAKTIWLAQVVGGRLVDLDNGRDRRQVIDRAIELARQSPRTVIGLDFAFGFPEWYARREGWASGRAVWGAMRDRGDALLQACEPPFWGRPGTRAQQLGDPLRETERATPPAKSVFQIGGAGAVGTGSVRGMPHLLELSDAGFAVWPFDDSGWPLVVEIYPRPLTGEVIKTRPPERRRYMDQRFPDQPEKLRARAAETEDAFDAAVSALVMAQHLKSFDALSPVEPGDARRIEGSIWTPSGPSV